MTREQKLVQLVEDCQAVVADYMPPDSGISREEAFWRLTELLDGPRAREALAPAS